MYIDTRNYNIVGRRGLYILAMCNMVANLSTIHHASCMQLNLHELQIHACMRVEPYIYIVYLRKIYTSRVRVNFHATSS